MARTVCGIDIETLDDVMHANAKAGRHFFDPAAMRFFASRAHRQLYGSRYFVTSERGPDGVRRYSVRELGDDGDIGTVGGFQAHPTSQAAHREAKALGNREWRVWKYLYHITYERPGISVTVTLDDDCDTRPSDFDCYSPEQIEAWERGEWRFVCLFASVLLDGEDDDEAATTNILGGVEDGCVPGIGRIDALASPNVRDLVECAASLAATV